MASGVDFNPFLFLRRRASRRQARRQQEAEAREEARRAEEARRQRAREAGARRADMDVLLLQFPEADRDLAMSVLVACGDNRGLATEKLSDIMGEPPFKECAVCMERPREVRFECGHACCCESCATTLSESAAPLCPQCRAHISKGAWTTEPDRHGTAIGRQSTYRGQQPEEPASTPAAASSPAPTGRQDAVVGQLALIGLALVVSAIAVAGVRSGGAG
ncbi:hypothetical protein EMIHUDRAFT_100184 [Emiliania huxleyi CCMP1516]|uniref:RING-type domain-containing protein n=2 Tax=Emiliania huxleyi TaxID=2903 RepID=A0A0D3JWD6_EMIH1|nr:hypothetical protein EMIHUDRAFT_100184 [Emiliania huxleyi CCMP1516]EOD27821.1 hypothetical protein EMIHUDRAFT_100184 [Emiliania huxleyi CCMP1516]|eukprot:XP_005780250.1 hypothetical protein EMIHUDRAFT_100184 [Emiliania huxleyi CCMP1516]